MKRFSVINQVLVITAIVCGNCAPQLAAIEPFAKPIKAAGDDPPTPGFPQEAKDFYLVDDHSSQVATSSTGYKRVWFQWESKRPQRMTGRVELRGSQISNFKRLGTAGDEITTIQPSISSIDIFPGAAHAQNGFVFESKLTAASVLVFELQGERGAANEATVHVVPLAKLNRKRAIFELPGDIRVTVFTEASPTKLIYQRNHLIFNPGETFRFEIVLDEIPTRPKTMMHCVATLKSARGKEVLAVFDQDSMTDVLGQFQGMREFEIPLPQHEGAYELELQISSKPQKNSTSRSQVVSQRKLDLVVIDPSQTTPQQSVDIAAWTLIQEADLGKMTLIANDGKTLAAKRAFAKPQEQKDNCIERSLQVFGTVVGQPHIAELACMGSEHGDYELSVQAIDRGKTQRIVASRFRIDHRSQKINTHQVIFWPNATEVEIVVKQLGTNKRESSTRLRIYAGPETLPPLNSHIATGQRIVAAYLDTPDMGRRFGGTYPQTSQAVQLADWKYHLESANRQAQLLNNAGYSAAMLTVASGGGSIYPSSNIEPSTRFDNSELFLDGAGTPRKDILELLFRIYDRNQMLLIPTIRFDFPIADLQRQILSGDQSVRMRNDREQTWWDANPNSNALGPYYNPANPSVQLAMQRIVDELVDRYAQHTSFGGVAIVVDDGTYVQFPAGQWGSDSATQASFKEQHKQELVASHDSKSDRNLFDQWQARQLTKLFVGMSSNLYDAKSQHKLFVIDNLSKPSQSHIAVREKFLQPDCKLPAIAWICASQSQGDATSSRRTSSAQPTAIDKPMLQPPLVKQKNVLVAEVEPIESVGAAGRSRWMQTFVATDADIMVHPLRDLGSGQIASRRNMFAAIQALPMGSFEDVPSTHTDERTVCVRTAHSPVARYGYVVNNSSWPTNVQVTFNHLSGLDVNTVSNVTTSRPSDNVWQVRIEPYDMVSFRVASSDVQIVDWNVLRDEADSAEMMQWITTIDRHIDAAKNLRLVESTILHNADFQQSDADGKAVGWNVAHGAGIAAELVNDDSDSDTSLSIRTAAPRGWPTASIGWARSQSFAAPPSGRLLCVARVRAEDDFATTRLKMVVSGRLSDRPYHESVWIDASMPTSVRDGHDLDTTSPYRHAGIQILDMQPSADNELQISFEVHDGGTVWIDQVALYDGFLTSAEIVAIESMRDDAITGVDENNFSPLVALKQAPITDKLLTQTPVILSALQESMVATEPAALASATPTTSVVNDRPNRVAAQIDSDTRNSGKTLPVASSRRTARMASRPRTADTSNVQALRKPSIPALDDFEFGMIGSEPVAKLPSDSKVTKLALKVPQANVSQARREEVVDLKSIESKPAAPSFGQRLARWLRLKPRENNGTVVEQSQSAERVSQHETGTYRKK